MKNLVLSTILTTIILFLWSGLAQVLPWGITTSQNISVQTTEPVNAPNLIQLPPDTLTTEKFDEQFIGKISTYTTDKTFSWIVAQPLNVNYAGYFAKELITQFIVALLLSTLLLLTTQLTLITRLVIVGIAALAAGTATYGQLINWWAMPLPYALGVCLNLIIGWLLASFISARFIIKTNNLGKL